VKEGAPKPRVLLVGRTRYSPPLPAWLQKKFDALEAELDYRVLASAGPGGVSEGRFELMQPTRPGALDGALFHALLPFRVARAIRRHRPDAIVAEDPHIAAAALLARRLAGGRAPKVVAEVHGNWRLGTRLYGSPARRLFAPLADVLDSFAVRRADAVRALSPYTARLVEEVRGRPPDAAFPTYSDLSAFTGSRRPRPERPTALFVGVLERYKGIDTLAAAWPRVAAAVPGARLVVVGRGSRARLIEGLGAEHVEQLAPAEVAARMDDSWVLVLPSRHEGLGRVVIESFARGRGVVGGRAGGILDLVREGEEGLLVEPGDVDGLVEALRRVLSDRALAERLGAAAARRFEDWRSTPEEFARHVRALVDASLNSGSL
jgi:glycosyltransferase involved in cell wall biosynthesis